MFKTFRQLLGLIRFSHTVFALPFALLSAILAWQTKPQGFSWIELAGILLCMVFARSAAMAFNRLADRSLDAANPRTANRHLPRGQLSVGTVWLFTAFCATGFVASTVLFLLADPPNSLPILLSGPVLLFICGYSFAKRFTALAHVWLGASLFLSPLAAWIAIRGFDDLQVPLVIGLTVLSWVTGFDIIYACRDVDFDRAARLASIPARFGVKAALRIAFAFHLLMLAMLVVFYFVAVPPMGAIYLIGIALVAALLLYEHSLVRPDDLTRVNQAFFHVNAVISLGLLAVVVLQLVIGI